MVKLHSRSRGTTPVQFPAFRGFSPISPQLLVYQYMWYSGTTCKAAIITGLAATASLWRESLLRAGLLPFLAFLHGRSAALSMTGSH